MLTNWTFLYSVINFQKDFRLCYMRLIRLRDVSAKILVTTDLCLLRLQV